MPKSEWRSVTEESPCHVCGKSGWCSVSGDRKKAICRRRNNGSGVHRVDKSGQDYWLYDMNGHGAPHPPEESTEDHEVPDKAEPQTLHRVYGALLDGLSLDPDHRENLRARGLSDTCIMRGKYRSLPPNVRENLACRLVERFGTDTCSAIPGLYQREGGGWTLAGAAGMLVPVRDLEGRIVALKVRADDPGRGPKYAYLSSNKHGGPGPGAQVHVPLHEVNDLKVARLTEGELKADVATALTEILTVSAPGVSSWRQALPVLESLGAEWVYLAFDSDAKENEHVSRALKAVFNALEERGFEVALEMWQPELGKGVDDLLAAGHTPELLVGEEVRSAVNGIAAAAAGVSQILKNAVTAEELMGICFPEPRWVVPGIVPAGATILAGKPKIGKSWLALGVAVAVASDGIALGTKKVEQGAVLYLALEDNPRRLQARLKKLLPSGKAPRDLILADRWPRPGDGGLEALEAWLISRPDARLVVIDTLAKFRNAGSGRNVYKEDYEATEPLVELAARYDVAILVVHHLRKLTADDPLDQVSGSMGLTGGADGVLVINRERGRADAYLYVTGRDIEEEKEYALSWDQPTATWKIVGNAEEYRLSQERQEIYECIRTMGGSASPKEVSEALSKPHNNVKQLMWKMDNDGDLRNVGGSYTITNDNSDNHDNRCEPSETPEGSSMPPLNDDVHFNEGCSAPPVIQVTEVIENDARTPHESTSSRLVTTQDGLELVTGEIRSARTVALDLETTGLNPRTERIRLISISTGLDSWVIDCFQVDPSPLFPTLACKKLIMHNGAFDLGFLMKLGFELGEGGEIVDTMLISQLLDNKEAA